LKFLNCGREVDVAVLIAIVTFLIAACVVFGLWLTLGGGGAMEDVIQRRLEEVRRTERRGNVSLEVKILRDEMLSNVPELNQILIKSQWVGSLRKYMNQAGVTTKPANILLFMAVLGLTAYIFVQYLYHQTSFSVIAAVIGASVPVAVISWKRRKRFAKFEERLPDALDLLGRAVRAGHSFTTGLELIAEESAEPIAGEFRTTFEEQNLGLPLRDSLLNLTERMPLVDVRLLVTALLIQRDSGGNLAEILDELSRVIRERFRIYREVKVKTAQGRLTAGILIAMPLIMLAVIGALNPGYIRVLFVDPTGRTMLMVAAGMQIFGSLLLWKIVNIEV
jgi:tight adherence protein B